MSINKISKHKYTEFKLAYYFWWHENKRYGEAFMESTFPDVEDEELFNIEDDEMAEKIILDKYVEN